jgi:hypothetical protein
LGFWVWVLGVGPLPNPQSPIPIKSLDSFQHNNQNHPNSFLYIYQIIIN